MMITDHITTAVPSPLIGANLEELGVRFPDMSQVYSLKLQEIIRESAKEQGIDLKEERLIGAVIIGTGLPQVNTEQEILKEYFDEHGEHGFDYAYQYPGMNKVMQAAGRVIRTVHDRGIIALLDDRFLRPEYVALFPREWGTYTVVNRYNVDQAVRAFWDGAV